MSYSSVDRNVSDTPQMAQAYFYMNVQQNMTHKADIYYYILIKYEDAKCDSRLVAYWGVVFTMVWIWTGL